MTEPIYTPYYQPQPMEQIPADDAACLKDVPENLLAEEPTEIERIESRFQRYRLVSFFVVVALVCGVLFLAERTTDLGRKLFISQNEPRYLYLKSGATGSQFRIGLTGFGPNLALLDAQGKKRGEIIAQENQTSLSLFNNAQHAAVRIAVDAEGSRLEFLHKDVQNQFFMDFSKIGPGLNLFETYKNLKMGLVQSSDQGVEFLDESDRVRIRLTESVGGPAMNLFDEQGKKTASFSLAGDEPQIDLLDEFEQMRARLHIADGMPRLAVYNPEQKKRAEFQIYEGGPGVAFFDQNEVAQEIIGLNAAGVSLTLLQFQQPEVIPVEPVLPEPSAGETGNESTVGRAE